MAVFSPSSQNPLGLHPTKSEKVRAKMRESVGLQGSLVRFNFIATGADTIESANFGGESDPSSNVILAGAGDTNGSILGVLAQDLAQDEEGWVYIRGVVDAVITNDVTVGEFLTAGAGGIPVSTTAGDNACIISLLGNGSGSTRLQPVALDGVNFFGVG